jgi:hypothetical protein
MDLSNSGGDFTARIDQLLELVQHGSIATESDGADLDYLGADWMQAGSLQVEGDELRLR